MKLRGLIVMLALPFMACGKTTEEERLPEQTLLPPDSGKPTSNPNANVPSSMGGTIPDIPVETYLVDQSRFNPRTKDRTVTFRFTSNIDGARFECSLNSAEYIPCAGGDSVTLTDLFHGKGYTLKVRAITSAEETDASPLEIRFVCDTSYGGPAYGPEGAYGYIPGSSRDLPYPGVPYSGGYGEMGNPFPQPPTGGFPGYPPAMNNAGSFDDPLNTNIGASGTRYGFGSGFPQGHYNASPFSGNHSYLGVFNAGPRQLLLGESDLALVPNNMMVRSYGTQKNLKASQVYFRLADSTNPNCNQSYEILVQHPSGVLYCEGYPVTRTEAEERLGLPIDHLILESQSGGKTQEKLVTVINDAEASLAQAVEYGSICPNPQRQGQADAVKFSTSPQTESNQLRWCLVDEGTEGVWWVAQFDAIVAKNTRRERLTAAYMVRANYGGFTPWSDSFVTRAERFLGAVIMPTGQSSL